jgi:anti-anti-sigma factor
MNDTIIEFARIAQDVTVIRIQGRGTFQNSIELKHLTQTLRDKNPLIRFIIDLDKCDYLDSTFMGTLARITLEQKKAGSGYATVLNTREHTQRLLKNLGLSYILDIRDSTETVPVQEKDFQKADAQEPVPKFEQIVHMIKAHEQLIDIDNQNEVRFQSVLKYLMESLDREKKKQT